jgi:ribosomal protein S18 acetylase RimI-like enzyme
MTETKDLKYYSRRLRQEFARRGAIGLGKLVVLNIMKRTLSTRKATWYRLRLNELVPFTQKGVPGSFGLMNIGEASGFFEKNHASFPWMSIEEELETARAADHMFPCVRDKGEVVGYIKLGIEKVFISDFEKILHLQPTAAFIYDTFVMPSYRRTGLGTYLIGMTARLAQEKGFLSLWCHIPSWNEPSIKAFRRAGFEAVGEVRFVRLLGRDFFHKRPGTFPLSTDDAPGKPGELKLNEALP